MIPRSKTHHGSQISNHQRPLEGYLMENGEFSASLSKDGRLTEGLKLTIEATDV